MTIVLVLHPSGQVNTLQANDPETMLVRFNEVLHITEMEQSWKVTNLALMRPDSNDVAVAWFGPNVGVVNEPGTKLARHCQAIHPLDAVRGPMIVGGPPSRVAPVTDPPSWASEVVYRYGREERERRKPRPHNQG